MARRRGGTAAGRAAGGAARVVLNERVLREMLEGDEGPVAKHLLKQAIMVERVAKQLVAVDTGRLRASISWLLSRDGKGLFALIGSLVEYAAHVEFGTINMEAQPYLRPALSKIA